MQLQFCAATVQPRMDKPPESTLSVSHYKWQHESRIKQKKEKKEKIMTQKNKEEESWLTSWKHKFCKIKDHTYYLAQKRQESECKHWMYARGSRWPLSILIHTGIGGVREGFPVGCNHLNPL